MKNNPFVHTVQKFLQIILLFLIYMYINMRNQIKIYLNVFKGLSVLSDSTSALTSDTGSRVVLGLLQIIHGKTDLEHKKYSLFVCSV